MALPRHSTLLAHGRCFAGRAGVCCLLWRACAPLARVLTPLRTRVGMAAPVACCLGAAVPAATIRLVADSMDSMEPAGLVPTFWQGFGRTVL